MSFAPRTLCLGGLGFIAAIILAVLFQATRSAWWDTCELSDKINLSVAFGTLSLAAATVVSVFQARSVAKSTSDLAQETTKLAQETAKSSMLADIHHQESHSGLLLWIGPREIFFDKSNSTITIYGRIQNVGPGVAIS
jgi:hypothetical protein